MDKQIVIDRSREWIRLVVMGLDLCPFAQRVFEGNKIRYVVTEAVDEEDLQAELARELEALGAAPLAAIETTLLIHPLALGNFLDFNDFLGSADGLVKKLGLRGVIQIASFHPDYQFAGTDADAVENYSNRSPYPMLHLLREESISRAGDPDDLLEIPRRNTRTLASLGKEKILEILKGCGPSNG